MMKKRMKSFFVVFFATLMISVFALSACGEDPNPPTPPGPAAYTVTGIANGTGYTMAGASSATNGSDYSFTVTVSAGYQGTPSVAYTIGGTAGAALTPVSAAKVHTFTIAGSAVTGNIVIGAIGGISEAPPEAMTYAVTGLTNGVGFAINGEALATEGTDYSFTVTPQAGRVTPASLTVSYTVAGGTAVPLTASFSAGQYAFTIPSSAVTGAIAIGAVKNFGASFDNVFNAADNTNNVKAWDTATRSPATDAAKEKTGGIFTPTNWTGGTPAGGVTDTGTAADANPSAKVYPVKTTVGGADILTFNKTTNQVRINAFAIPYDGESKRWDGSAADSVQGAMYNLGDEKMGNTANDIYFHYSVMVKATSDFRISMLETNGHNPFHMTAGSGVNLSYAAAAGKFNVTHNANNSTGNGTDGDSAVVMATADDADTGFESGEWNRLDWTMIRYQDGMTDVRGRIYMAFYINGNRVVFDATGNSAPASSGMSVDVAGNLLFNAHVTGTHGPRMSFVVPQSAGATDTLQIMNARSALAQTVQVEGVANGTGYTMTGASTVKELRDYTFTVTVAEGFHGTPDIAYTIGGTAGDPLTPEVDGKTFTYTIPGAALTGKVIIESIGGITAFFSVNGLKTDAQAAQEGLGYIVTGASIVDKNAAYTFTVEIRGGYTAGTGDADLNISYKIGNGTAIPIVLGAKVPDEGVYQNGWYAIEIPAGIIAGDLTIIVEGVIKPHFDCSMTLLSDPALTMTGDNNAEGCSAEEDPLKACSDCDYDITIALQSGYVFHSGDVFIEFTIGGIANTLQVAKTDAYNGTVTIPALMISGDIVITGIIGVYQEFAVTGNDTAGAGYTVAGEQLANDGEDYVFTVTVSEKGKVPVVTATGGSAVSVFVSANAAGLVYTFKIAKENIDADFTIAVTLSELDLVAEDVEDILYLNLKIGKETTIAFADLVDITGLSGSVTYDFDTDASISMENESLIITAAGTAVAGDMIAIRLWVLENGIRIYFTDLEIEIVDNFYGFTEIGSVFDWNAIFDRTWSTITSANDASTPEERAILKGNYVLTEDIDFDGGVVKTIGKQDRWTGSATAGHLTRDGSVPLSFRGILDGNGFALKNFTLQGSAYNNALFAGLGGGTIRNISLLNVTNAGVATDARQAILVNSVYAGVIENVFIHGNIHNPSGVNDGSYANAGTIFGGTGDECQEFLGATGTPANVVLTVRNVVTFVTATGTRSNRVYPISGRIAQGHGPTSVKFENLFIVTDGLSPAGSEASRDGNALVSGATTVLKLANLATTNFTGLDKNLWDLTAGKLPVLKDQARVSVSLDEDDINLTDAEPSAALVATTDPAGEFVLWISANPAVATVSQSGLVTAVKTGTTKITAITQTGAFAECSVTVDVKMTAIGSTLYTNWNGGTTSTGFLNHIVSTNQGTPNGTGFNLGPGSAPTRTVVDFSQEADAPRTVWRGFSLTGGTNYRGMNYNLTGDNFALHYSFMLRSDLPDTGEVFEIALRANNANANAQRVVLRLNAGNFSLSLAKEGGADYISASAGVYKQNEWQRYDVVYAKPEGGAAAAAIITLYIDGVQIPFAVNPAVTPAPTWAGVVDGSLNYGAALTGNTRGIYFRNAVASGKLDIAGVLNPVAVSTRADLEAIAGSMTNRHYYLTKDIDLGGKIYTTAVIPGNFAGIFDGNGYAISNYAVTGTGSVGTFGSVHGGSVIRNLTIDGATITGTGTNSWTVGGLVTGAYNATITNCAVINATLSTETSGGKIGVLVGSFENPAATIEGGNATDATNGSNANFGAGLGGLTVKNNVTNGVRASGSAAIGGIVGWSNSRNGSGNFYMTSATVTVSAASGTSTGHTPVSASALAAGFDFSSLNSEIWNNAVAGSPVLPTLKNAGNAACGHDFSDHDDNCLTASVCSVCGVADDDAKAHTPGDPADCEHAQTCTDCGTVLAPALGHDYVADPADCTADKTCSRCPATSDGEYGDHDYVADPTDCTADKTCSHCTATSGGEYGDHDYVADPADCTADQTCSHCTATTSSDYDDHDWVDGACENCTTVCAHDGDMTGDLCDICGVCVICEEDDCASPCECNGDCDPCDCHSCAHTAHGECCDAAPDAHIWVDGVCACGEICLHPDLDADGICEECHYCSDCDAYDCILCDCAGDCDPCECHGCEHIAHGECCDADPDAHIYTNCICVCGEEDHMTDDGYFCTECGLCVLCGKEDGVCTCEY